MRFVYFLVESRTVSAMKTARQKERGWEPGSEGKESPSSPFSSPVIPEMCPGHVHDKHAERGKERSSHAVGTCLSPLGGKGERERGKDEGGGERRKTFNGVLKTLLWPGLDRRGGRDTELVLSSCTQARRKC